MQCKYCGTELILGVNWTVARMRNSHYMCKSCANKRAAEWSRKNRDKRRAIERRYVLAHREKIREIKRRTWQRRKREREQLMKEFGGKCLFCGQREHLVLHEKNGVHHPLHIEWQLRNKDNLVLLDRDCHGSVHFCMRYLGMSWDEIYSRFVSLAKTPAVASVTRKLSNF